MNSIRVTRKAGTRRSLAFMFLALAAAPATALELDGNLQWARRVELSTPVSGVVDRIPVEVGQRVDQGTGLLYLDQRRPEAAVEEAEAEQARLQSVLAEARRELERARELYDRTLLSEHDLELAKIEYATARANFASAKAALVDARLDLEYSVIRAPFPALVLAVNAQKGQTVVSELEAKPLVTVAESHRMVARILVSEEQVSEIAEGDGATVGMQGRTFPGRVERVGLEPVGEAGRYAVDILFDYDPGEGVLRAGRKVEVNVP